MDDRSYFRDVFYGIVIFAIITIIAGWLGNGFGNSSSMQYIEGDSSWDPNGF